MRSWVCCLQAFNLLQIAPQLGGCIGDQPLISGREKRYLQLAVFETPPADYGSINKNSGTDDPGEVEDVTHMLFGQEQAFCFLIAQHELVKASQEQTIGKIASRQTIINVETGLAVMDGFGKGKLF